MSIVNLVGEMNQKGSNKQFTYWQIEHFEDFTALVDKIGQERFVEALNTGLEAIARKRQRTSKDGRLTGAQLTNIKRMNDLIALDVMTFEHGFELLVNQGIDPEVLRENLKRREE